MALPTTEAILAARKGKVTRRVQPLAKPVLSGVPDTASILKSMPKPVMNQTFGARSIADYPVKNAPADVQNGLNRIKLYDPTGTLVRKPFLASASGVEGSTPATSEEGSGTILPRIAGEEGDVYDKALGAIAAPGPLVLAGLKRLGINADTTDQPVEGMTEKLRQIFEGGIGQSQGNAKKFATPLAITAGFIADPFNLTGLGESEAVARAIQLAQKSDNAVPDIINILKKSGIAEDVAAAQAEHFAQADFDTIQKSLQNLSVKKPFTGYDDLSTKILKDLEGRTTVSKQYLLDATNRPELKQDERDLVRNLLQNEGDKIDATAFAEKIKEKLLPLHRTQPKSVLADSADYRYEGTNLPDELRGPVANYDEHIYESPIHTNAGDIHYPSETSRYFAHTRVEDIPNPKPPSGISGIGPQAVGDTRRVLEVQSDLMQKGNLERELPDSLTVNVGGKKYEVTRNRFGIDEKTPKEFSEFHSDTEVSTNDFMSGNGVSVAAIDPSVHKLTRAEAKAAVAEAQKVLDARRLEVAKLEPYRNTWHERVIREEVKQAAIDGKTRLQFPTGETAMKIEGLGGGADWRYRPNPADDSHDVALTEDAVEIGREIAMPGGDSWIITDNLGDGEFVAVQKRQMDMAYRDWKGGGELQEARNPYENKLGMEEYKDFVENGDINSSALDSETFNISKEIDPENPIYKFYEKEVGRYLRKKFGATLVTDPQGVKWWEVDIKPGMAKAPVEAYGAAAGVETDENGNVKVDPVKAALGVAALSIYKNPNVIKKIAESSDRFVIADTLSEHFNKLPQSILDAFAKRMATLKKTSDIEPLLGTLQRLDVQAGQDVLKDTMVPVRDLITKKESEINLDLLTRSLGTQDNEGKLSAAAANEYDELWRHVDEKAVDRFNEANVERSILEDVMSSSRGKELNMLYKGTFISPRDTSLGELVEQMNGMRKDKYGNQVQFDSRIDEIMGSIGGDMEPAQKELDNFLAQKDRLENLRTEIRDLRPMVQKSQLVRSILEGLPVISNKEAKGIDDLVNSATVRDFTDISGFKAYVRDPDRNFQKFFGRYYPRVRELFLDPLDEGKRAFVDAKEAKREALMTQVVEKFGINRGSEEAAAVQDWGERDLMSEKATANPDSVYHTREALVAKFGEEQADKITHAADWFRTVYDKAIEEANKTLKKIYPNDPTKLIPYRKDYFHHFQELSDGFMDAIRNFMDVPGGIDPKLIGVSEFTTPKQKFKSFAQVRKGPRTQRDAIEGYLRFMEGVEYLKNIEPHISRFRYLRRKIAEVAPRSGTTVDNVMQPGVDHMLWFLDQFAHNLSGKTSPLDRFVQEVIPGGRPMMKMLDFVTNRIKANTMLGSAGTTLAQMANIPAVIGETKQHAIPGFARTIADIFDVNGLSRDSSFLRERFANSYKMDFPIDFAKHPFKRSEEEVAKVFAWVLKGGDMIGSRLAWNSFLEKYLAENRALKDGVEVWKDGANMEEASKYADLRTRRLVAGRGIGELALAQREKTMQALIPFTVEVNNFWSWAAERGMEKDFGALAIFVLANYLYNETMQKVRGSRVSYDPINALIEGSDTFMQEYRSGHPLIGGAKFAGRQAGEIVSNVGGGQLLTGGLPDSIAGIKKGDIFGQGDPNRFGSPILMAGALKSPTDAAARLLTPMAGVQIKKSWEGINALIDEQAKSKTTGKATFPIARTPENIFRATVFGPYSTTEAQNSFDSGDALHTELSIQSRDDAMKSLDAEAVWREIKALPADQRVAVWDQKAKENPELMKKVKQIAADEKKGITANDRLILMLHVTNGARAKYIVDQITSLKTKEEKTALWNEYVQKKIITKEVAAQVTQMLAK